MLHICHQRTRRVEIVLLGCVASTKCKKGRAGTIDSKAPDMANSWNRLISNVFCSDVPRTYLAIGGRISVVLLSARVELCRLTPQNIGRSAHFSTMQANLARIENSLTVSRLLRLLRYLYLLEILRRSKLGGLRRWSALPTCLISGAKRKHAMPE